MKRLLPVVLVLAACVPGGGGVVPGAVQEIPAVASSGNGIWRTYFNVRTYVGDTSTEVTGADCRIEGPGISGSFTTPARIRFPVFQSGRMTTRLTCTRQGQSVTVEKSCTYSSGQPQGNYAISTSTCNQSIVPVIFPRG